jgi:hypothetical protein
MAILIGFDGAILTGADGAWLTDANPVPPSAPGTGAVTIVGDVH